MGSGSFLVQVCRWLGDRVVEAWYQEEAIGAVIDVDGQHHEQDCSRAFAQATEERIIIARRLVAERCIYGIDINPLAVGWQALRLAGDSGQGAALRVPGSQLALG